MKPTFNMEKRLTVMRKAREERLIAEAIAADRASDPECPHCWNRAGRSVDPDGGLWCRGCGLLIKGIDR